MFIKIQGDFAFFGKGDKNKNVLDTFEHIHPMVVKGLIGAILGYPGFKDEESEDSFWNKLANIKITIYAKQRKFKDIEDAITDTTLTLSPATVIEKRRLLTNVDWIIEIHDEKIEDELTDRINRHDYIYMPYLGKNEYFANISICEKDDSYYQLFEEKTDETEITINLPVGYNNGEYVFGKFFV